MQKKETVVIILPTYNEASNISDLIPKLQGVFKKEQNYNFIILVVDDNSPDGTSDVVRKFMKKYKNIELLTGEKRGLGAAYVRGMRHAVDKLNADILFEMDSDLSHDPKLIPLFLKKIKEGADFVIGSRYIPGGSIPKDWAWQRKLFSAIGNLIVRFGLMIPHIKEWSSGYRAIHANVFVTVNKGLEQYAGYTFQIAFLHRVYNEGYTIVETPLNFIDRKHGESKFQVLNYAPNVIKYVLFNSSFIRFAITGFIGFGVDFGIAYILIASLRLYEPLANATSAAVAITSNFIINNYWSFSHKRITGGASVVAKKYGAFILVAACSVAIQGIGMFFALSLFGNKEMTILGIDISAWIIYKVLIIGFIIIPYSYVMYNRFIWNK